MWHRLAAEKKDVAATDEALLHTDDYSGQAIEHWQQGASCHNFIAVVWRQFADRGSHMVSRFQEKALALEERLAAKEAECEGLLKQASRAGPEEKMARSACLSTLTSLPSSAWPHELHMQHVF